MMLSCLLAAIGAAEPERPYPPAPIPVDTGRYQLGAILCPLWAGGTRWRPITPFADRQPLLGWYDEGDPEVTDWEVTWALDHGISFFLVCWYRANDTADHEVRPALGEWLHHGLFGSRHGRRAKFAILFENGNAHFRGRTSERDLLEHLLPYWTETYFRRDEYLLADDRPVLAIYNVRRLVEDLGGEEPTARILGAMRAQCRAAGFAGLVVLGQYCWGRPEELVGQAEQVRRVGFDASWSYHWPTFTGAFGDERRPTGAQAIAAQERLWTCLPQPNLLTLSTGWDSEPWGFSLTRTQWRLTPSEFEQLARRAKAVLEARDPASLAGRLVLLDNWNEYGEGHYLMPTREHGFGYLDALRRVFAPGAGAHRDRVPEELGLGPYDRAWRAVSGEPDGGR